MKDKLRELAEMVREAYRAGFIAACKWPAPVSQDVDSSAYTREFNSWSFSVREKHTAILDADGDGGAVAWLHEVIADDGIADLALSFEPDSFPFADVAGYQSIKHSPLYTHPARSGVVSDEDVESALSVYEETTHDDALKSGMRATLEHFAKGERHER